MNSSVSMNICLLVSGNLGYVILKDLYDSNYNLSAVFTDNNSVEIIKFCSEKNLSLFVGNPRNNKSSEFLFEKNSDLIISVNYLFIIDQQMINHPKLMSVNFHGSILPKYRGRTPHVWAIINGESQTGITAHIISEGVDQGEIIDQKIISISERDTGGSILLKFNKCYPDFVKKVILAIENGTFNLSKQDHTQATYFGKRSPEDGQINWSWQKDRIINWVRAQAKPYPGAFTFYNEEKVIIHSAKSNNFGFHFQTKNGTILSINKKSLIVKTPNGCLEISNLEFDHSIKFEVGKSFS